MFPNNYGVLCLTMICPCPFAIQVFQALDGAHPNLHVFKREDFPKRLHYANNARNLKIIGYADPPYEIYSVSDASF